MSGAVRYGNSVGGAPFESNQAYIAVAHGALAQEIDAML